MKRALKAKVDWLAKCEAAKAGGKNLPEQPALVRFEKSKENPDCKNLVCLNQSTERMSKAYNKYGNFKLRCAISLRQKPSTIVTLRPIETALAAYPNIQHSEERPR